MKFAVQYRLKREKGTMYYTATFSRIVGKESFKTPIKDDKDYLTWIVIPEWIKQGAIFIPVKDFKNIDKYIYYEVYSFIKKNDNFVFEIINVRPYEKLEELITDYTNRFTLSLNYDKYTESGKFTLDQLVRQKVIEKQPTVKKRRLAPPELDFEE